MRHVRLLAALLSALTLASACAQADTPRPLLWKISDADNEIYLLGSFHALKPEDYPLAASVDAAFADAERLAFEVSPEEMNSPSVQQKLLAAAMLPEGAALEKMLSPQAWTRLQAYAQRRGVPLQQYARFEPWLVSLVISLNEMGQIGFDPQLGLDRKLMARAGQAGKTTLGLESVDEQVAALDSMTAVEQQQMLEDALDEIDKLGEEIDALHRMWRSGDDVALTRKTVDEFRQKYPQLYQRIDVARNRAWLPKLQALLDKEHSDDTLVVVGSMHLLGEDGLIALLKAKGYKIERL